MEEKYKLKLKNALKSGNLFETVKHAIVKRWPVQIIRNPGICELQMQDKTYRKLRKKYNHIITNDFYKLRFENKRFEKLIWWCWLQGVENAPTLVQRCYESLVENMKDYELRVITFENLDEYTNLPDYVVEKYKKGWITAANFSDMIRMDVLAQYGGIWIDSTVLCTGTWLNETMEEVPLFFFQDIMSLSKNIAGSSWLISAKANNPVICMTRDLMFEYWKCNKIAIHYYLVHLFFTMALHEFPEISEKIPVFNNAAPHTLVNELDSKYDAKRYEAIKLMSPFHKLNYKRQYKTDERSFYSKLILKKGIE